MKGTARMSWELSAQERKIWISWIFLILIRWNNSRKVESVVLKWVFKKRWKSLTSEFTKFETVLYVNVCYVLIFVSFRPLSRWDCGFESHRGHGCLLWVLCVVRWRSLRRIDHSPRGVLPTVARRCVWSRNLENEEAKARYGAVEKTTTMCCNAKKTNKQMF